MSKPPIPNNHQPKKLPPKAKPPVFKPQDYARSNIPLIQIQQLKQAFDLFDYSGQGKIDPKELKTALSLQNMETKNNTFYNAICNIQKQGLLDFGKFIEAITARSGLQKTRANLKKVFAIFDKEKSGFVSKKNLKQITKDIGLSITDQELEDIIQKSDLDNDGLVSEEEFYLIMTKKSKRY